MNPSLSKSCPAATADRVNGDMFPDIALARSEAPNLVYLSGKNGGSLATYSL